MLRLSDASRLRAGGRRHSNTWNHTKQHVRANPWPDTERSRGPKPEPDSYSKTSNTEPNADPQSNDHLGLSVSSW